MGCLVRGLLAVVLMAALAYILYLFVATEPDAYSEFDMLADIKMSTEIEMSGRSGSAPELTGPPTSTVSPVPTETSAPTGAPSPVPTMTPVSPWYVGGTLHDASFDEWFRATAANRLATAADWVGGVDTPTMQDTNRLHIRSDELIICIRDSAGTTPATWTVSQLATICLAPAGQPSDGIVSASDFPAHIIAYAEDTMPHIDKFTVSMEELSQLFHNPRWNDSDWLLAVSTNFAILRLAHERLSRIVPPSELTDIHRKLLEATSLVDEATYVIADSVDTLDAGKLEYGNSLLFSSSQRMNEVSGLLEDYLVLPARASDGIFAIDQITLVPTSTPTGWHKQISGIDFWSDCPCDQGNTLNCPESNDDKEGHYRAHACFERCKDLGYGDVHDLDRDSDNAACEWHWSK